MTRDQSPGGQPPDRPGVTYVDGATGFPPAVPATTPLSAPVPAGGRAEPLPADPAHPADPADPAATDVLDGTAVTGPDAYPDEDDDLLAPVPPRTNRWTLLLTGALVAAVAFGAGAVVQRNTGTTAAGPAAGFSRSGGEGFPGGFGGGEGFTGGQGYGGGQGFGGQGQGQGTDGQGSDGQGTGGNGSGASGSGGSGSGASGSGGSGSGGSASMPAVIGTVVKVDGTTITVKNLGGETVTVTVPEGTKITTSQTISLGELTPGTTITVTGTKNDDGDVTASAVTARPKE